MQYETSLHPLTYSTEDASDPWLTVERAADQAHLPEIRLRMAIAAGELRAALVGGSLVVHRAWLAAWSLPQRHALERKVLAAGDGQDAA